MEILFVCTANVCRSPLAEACLRALAGSRPAGAEDLVVSSAGLLADGLAVDPVAVGLLTERRIAIDPDRLSHRLTRDDVDRADLVLAMERRHVRDICTWRPEAWARTFTFKELLRRGREVGPRPAGEPISIWLGRIHEGRQTRELLGESPEDDVFDPHGGPAALYEPVVEEIAAGVGALAAFLWPTAR